jgi:hypothetical protein
MNKENVTVAVGWAHCGLWAGPAREAQLLRPMGPMQNSVGRRRGSREGAVGERAQAVWIPIRGVGRQEAHRRGRAVVMDSVVGMKMAVARTSGCRPQWRGRGGTTSAWGPSWSVDRAGGGRVAAVEGHGSLRKKTGDSAAHGDALASGSPWGWPVALEDEMSQLVGDLDGVGALGWWRAMANRWRGEHGSRARWGGCEGEGKSKKGKSSSAQPSVAIRSLTHVGRRPVGSPMATEWWWAAWSRPGDGVQTGADAIGVSNGIYCITGPTQISVKSFSK